jgi:hypothetical protein
VFAFATVSVGLVSCVSTQSPSFDAWIVNNSIFPQSMSRKRFKARSRTFPFAFTHSDALVVVDDLAPGHISESLWFLTAQADRRWSARPCLGAVLTAAVRFAAWRCSSASLKIAVTLRSISSSRQAAALL